jgi:heme oxygenase
LATYRSVLNSDQTLAISAMAELRAATWPSHQRLEGRLDVRARFSNLDSYRLHLQKMWGFCATVEEQLGQDRLSEVLPDYESRRKLSLLAQDLLALDAGAGFEEELDRCPVIATDRDRAAAFGCAYVLEGATLGGRMLLPLVQARLGVTARSGARFLASYGENVASMWARFACTLDNWCVDSEKRASAARAAVATFDALEAWLCGARSGVT